MASGRSLPLYRAPTASKAHTRQAALKKRKLRHLLKEKKEEKEEKKPLPFVHKIDMSWTSVLTCVALVAFVAPDATAAAMSVTVSGKTNGALAGRDVATIKINEAGVDAA